MQSYIYKACRRLYYDRLTEMYLPPRQMEVLYRGERVQGISAGALPANRKNEQNKREGRSNG